MNQQIRAEYSLQCFTASDALTFIMVNGVKQEEGTTTEEAEVALPGLSKVLELQAKHYDDHKTRHFGSYDPLCARRCTEVETHEEHIAHSQTACALAKNAVSAALQQRVDIRIHRYGEALVQLANASENAETEDSSTAMASDSAAGSPRHNRNVCAESNDENTEEAEEADTDEDNEDIETYLLKHTGFTSDTATQWLQRRYLRCCELMGVRPSVVVSHRLSQCVKQCFGGTVGSFFAAQNVAAPLSPAPERRSLTNTKAARNWMVFPEMLVLLREECAIPYEISPDLHGCGDVGKQPRHFVAALGVLEGCRYTVVSLNLSNIGLTDREVRVLCLFCHAHLRRLKVLDISDNPGVTDKVALRLKKMAASLPLLSRLSVHGTSLSPSTIRVIDRRLCRKVL
ncbi:hypothetical protein N2W54_003425 [Lotmaria passim]